MMLDAMTKDDIRKHFVNRTLEREFYLKGVCTNPYLFGDVMVAERPNGHTEEHRRHLASTACIWLGYEASMNLDAEGNEIFDN